MDRLLINISLALLIPVLSLQAQTNKEMLLQTCKARITAKFQQWRAAPVTAEVAKFARARHKDPTVTTGDFDGDGRQDLALLIQDGPAPGPDNPGRPDSLHIAVCLNQKTGISLFLIDKPYCSDGIERTLKGNSYYDFETGKRGTYRLDGVSAYCFEKAGATYEFENGIFSRIVDSD
jgi:hypothetical protein